MRQAWLARQTFELLLQLYWNLMETWPSKTSRWGINFHAMLDNRTVFSLLLQIGNQWNNKKKRWWWRIADCVRCSSPQLVLMEPRLSSPMGLLFKQASNYSLRYMTNLQLMQSVCVFSLGLFFSRYSGNWRKSQEQRQTRPDITLVPWAQEVSLLDEIVREGCVLNIGPENFVRPPFHLFLQRALLSSNKSKDPK